ncbi:MAG TPA: dTMP kinase, partial [Gammaproteobacteria bacterium]|nr:dTMP kinase [Gammaproteobacteria bacterium]
MGEPVLQAKGKFITLEGGEGVGKTTNLAVVKACLEAAGKRVLLTREPGGTPIGEKIRTILLDKGNAPLLASAELLLVFAARVQHVEEVIRPAIERGEWVLSDRFTDASYAYQGGGRGIDSARIAYLETWLLDNLQPDFTLLLDTSPTIGKHRAGLRAELDRFESEELAFFERVRQGYLQRAKAMPDR